MDLPKKRHSKGPLYLGKELLDEKPTMIFRIAVILMILLPYIGLAGEEPGIRPAKRLRLDKTEYPFSSLPAEIGETISQYLLEDIGPMLVFRKLCGIEIESLIRSISQGEFLDYISAETFRFMYRNSFFPREFRIYKVRLQKNPDWRKLIRFLVRKHLLTELQTLIIENKRVDLAFLEYLSKVAPFLPRLEKISVSGWFNKRGWSGSQLEKMVAALLAKYPDLKIWIEQKDPRWEDPSFFSDSSSSDSE